MLQHASTSILFVLDETEDRFDGLIGFLKTGPSMVITRAPVVPEGLHNFDVVVTVDLGEKGPEVERLSSFANSGGGWLAWITRGGLALPDGFGAVPGATKPECELRVLFRDRHHALAQRLPDALYVGGPLIPLETVDARTEILLYADWRYTHQWVLTFRKTGEGRRACTTLLDLEHPVLRQIFFRLLRRLAGQPENRSSLGVGLLGYAPSVGKLHGLGAAETAGLTLRAACDLDPTRREQAIQDFPDLRVHETGEALANDPDVDIVIIATPPNTHARLSVEMMNAGKNVVCEKPMALTRAETDKMVATAEYRKVHLSCHQNRRWDPDYLAIRQALAEGLIGELFHMETFVGRYHHPCGYWHSHAAVSGGTAYDWGAHYLDWIVSLIPEPVTGVIGTRHKRVWHDVTNADQERIQIRFAGGLEAEFLHSDIAAARKPKWYLLGTGGAIVGQWQDVSVYEIDPDHYFYHHGIPATEMTPDLTAYSRDRSGQMVSRKLGSTPRKPFAFHRNLADHLLTGEPLTAPLADSVKVVAILEAASRSADRGGTLEVFDA